MNQQELFDVVVAHARKQGKKSTQTGRTDGRCLYRGPDNLKCFMGTLIEDSEYHHVWEGMDIGHGLE